jgi:ribonuclease P protein component
MTKINTFPKKEHLCGEIRINRLFVEGKAFIAYPLRVMYKYEIKNTDTPVLVMVTVPKKRFKKAVHRNRIKRLIRENYRINKHELIAFCTKNNITLQISLAYVSNTELPFDTMTESIKIALTKIEVKIQSILLSDNVSATVTNI